MQKGKGEANELVTISTMEEGRTYDEPEENSVIILSLWKMVDYPSKANSVTECSSAVRPTGKSIESIRTRTRSSSV